ncbi:6-phosphofructo-2-kinase/fructose-2,6-bisphosphatase 2 [Hondaea fermentalgiana]|uniref:6-phosphofructo-2-kinase/fructose-2,6-bisphosphatase 2 n=1 Tax=Hondaea fermentalgiana TaxID=2315210 RepID=A0A2R5GX15_9STRA|nr:6-phosphofructo-2-kinase/fructose-2,6-bisphosphatase 2 [Hondaea fermentalgiana]|eukprot:GBG34869.1 6-phosphofructo-2-kinase/fructose-2,6-bisphosphatase 2 [Hondaea fermentalgiana]
MDAAEDGNRSSRSLSAPTRPGLASSPSDLGSSMFEKPLERGLSAEMPHVSVQRLCIVEEDRAGLLAEVTTRIGTLGLNIVGNTCKARGHLVFQVVDIEVAHDQTAAIVAEVEQIPGVRSASLGAFNSSTGKIYRETAPLRLCVVNENVPGVLGKVASLIEVDLGIKILAQVNRSRGDRAFNVFDVKNTDNNWVNVCLRVEEVEHVLSCTMGNFKAGGLAETVMTTRDEDYLSDVTDDALSVKSAAQTFARSPSTAATIVEETASLPEEEGESASPSVFVPPPPRPASSASIMARVKSSSGLPVRPAFAASLGLTPVGSSSNSVGGGDYYHGSRETSRSRTLMIMNERGALTKDASKLVIVMVGLPARGKSFTARKLKRFLCWRNSRARIFNAGKYRRERRNSTESTGNDNANFFEKSNEEGSRVRQEAANRALSDLLHFLQKSKQTAVGIFDATNSTIERRRWIVDQAKGIASVCFIEVICDDEEVLLENLLSKVRNSPDFMGMDERQALSDLRARIEAYERVYEPVDEDVSYIKIYNMSSKMLANKIYGRLARSILPYMLSLHVGLRPIYFVRAGLAEDSRISSMKHWPAEFDFLDPSTESKASGLSQLGHEFAQRLARWLQTALWVRDDEDADDAESFVEEQAGEGAHISNPLGSAFKSMPNLVDVGADGLSERIFHSERRREVRKADGTRQRGAVMKLLSSTLPRAKQTADIAKSLIDGSTVVELCPMLNPLNKGELGSLSMDAIQKLNPDFYESWKRHPYTHRFPGGESYLDLVTRLEPVLIEIEQQTAPCLIVSHVSCIQVLLAYFLGAPVEEAMKIKVPLHKLIEITPTLGGSWEMKEYEI